MATVIITLKVMPASPEEDLSKLEEAVKKLIEKYGGKFHKTDIEPIAFGLKALKMIFVVDESKGSTDALEEAIAAMESVASAEVIGVTRSLG